MLREGVVADLGRRKGAWRNQDFFPTDCLGTPSVPSFPSELQAGAQGTNLEAGMSLAELDQLLALGDGRDDDRCAEGDYLVHGGADLRRVEHHADDRVGAHRLRLLREPV